VAGSRCFSSGLCFCFHVLGSCASDLVLGSSDAEELVGRWSHCRGRWWLLFVWVAGGVVCVIGCSSSMLVRFLFPVLVVRDQRLGGIEDFWPLLWFGFNNPKGFGSVNPKGSGY